MLPGELSAGVTWGTGTHSWWVLLGAPGRTWRPHPALSVLMLKDIEGQRTEHWTSPRALGAVPTGLWVPSHWGFGCHLHGDLGAIPIGLWVPSPQGSGCYFHGDLGAIPMGFGCHLHCVLGAISSGLRVTSPQGFGCHPHGALFGTTINP